MNEQNINTASIYALSIFVSVLIKSLDENTRSQIARRLEISIEKLQKGLGENEAFPDRQFVAQILSKFLETVGTS